MDASKFAIGAGSVAINGSDVGGTTEEGVVIHYEPDVHLHKSGQFGNTPVKASLIGQTLTVEMWLAEHVLDNIEFVYAGVVKAGARIKFGGIAGRNIAGKALVITPFDGTESWHFSNAVPISSVDANYKVNDERIMHVTFQAMVDPNAPEAENLGYFS